MLLLALLCSKESKAQSGQETFPRSLSLGAVRLDPVSLAGAILPPLPLERIIQKHLLPLPHTVGRALPSPHPLGD